VAKRGEVGPGGRYPVPAGTHRAEETRERSRFIATIGRAATVEEARAFIDEVRSAFSDATHNCWAYVVGPPGDTRQIGMSDAGEPSGTAGRPMLDVLLGSGVGEIAAVVTRYYGGVKLGRGGLVRAYGGVVKLALDDLPLAEHVPSVDFPIEIDYPALDLLKSILGRFEAVIVDEAYGVRVALQIRLPAEHLEAFRQAVAGLTEGRVDPGADFG
jgi:uncharacterized YigZ family protein